MAEMTEYYVRKFEEGSLYQDYVTYQLFYKYGISINLFCTQEYQNKVGESASAIEIKFDGLARKTKNFFFEFEEKKNKNQENYVPSGFLRNDNTYLYLIGDYGTACLFSKRQLLHIYQHKEDYEEITVREAGEKTSRGLVIPGRVARDNGWIIKLLNLMVNRLFRKGMGKMVTTLFERRM